ncbi:Abortive infection protein [Cellulomonas flavigena DSM 20109]|uniref:Abortive infection protein n=1 Tax=Cellulomonas flavigena (strain ATCC 482 / DSM 20109 / BCRC 11376 / JCM 18109 / NBRC 3775 / NCIMB 8073 / NRS 134) TaxID=446466 RepID=D5UJZ3_CELFN|nr:type II CAAX endopeptidase family protein [Cellulomonas flavigena]ADG73735.1 Abortive infection protein [Cellulomonas flavigena DSM 20109]
MSSTYVVVDPTQVAGTYAYHRLARTRPGWWRPLLVGLVAGGLYLAALAAAAAVAGVVALVAGPGALETLAGLDLLDMRDPTSFALAMLTIVLMLPAVVVATRLLGARPVGLLASVAGRVRWGWAGRCLGLAAAVALVVQGLDLVVAEAAGTPWEPRVDERTVPLLVLVVLLVPAQCVAEEVLFRGYLVQAVGTWLRHPAFAVVLPVPLFVVGHAYVGLAMVDIAVWALAMGWLVWRTGGLEAASAAHVVNNTLVFTLGSVDLADLELVDIAPDALAISTLSTLVYVGLVELQVRRTRPARVRVVHAPAPVPVTWAAGGPAPAWRDVRDAAPHDAWGTPSPPS